MSHVHIGLTRPVADKSELAASMKEHYEELLGEM